MGLRINNEHDRNIVKITAHMALHLAQDLKYMASNDPVLYGIIVVIMTSDACSEC